MYSDILRDLGPVIKTVFWVVVALALLGLYKIAETVASWLL